METGRKTRFTTYRLQLLLKYSLLPMLYLLPIFAIAQDYTSNNKKAIKEFEKGQSALYQGKTSSAMQSFHKAAEMDNAFVEPRLILAEWFDDAGNALKAKQYYYAFSG